ncbi:MAG: hypothetical protein P8173_17760 [Gammaproteobacteria bacterium]
MPKKMAAFQFAYQANIKHYSEILRTDLTAQERAFFERRLAEEQAAFQKFLEHCEQSAWLCSLSDNGACPSPRSDIVASEHIAHNSFARSSRALT